MVETLRCSGILARVCLAATLTAGCTEVDDDRYDIADRNEEIVDNLLAAGFSEDDIEIRESMVLGHQPGPVVQERVFLGGDIHVPLEVSRQLAGDDVSFRHWQTPSLIDQVDATICLAKVTAAQAPYSGRVLTDDMKIGVDRAKYNFNQISGLTLNFEVGTASVNADGTFSHAISGCTHTIYAYQVDGDPGGSAGFPADGAPYDQIRLNSGLEGYSRDVHEHVATHEIGHAIGLRHTDWLTRVSCGNVEPEPIEGATVVPGTPHHTTHSLMASCFSSNTDGEFRGFDEIALLALYGE